MPDHMASIVDWYGPFRGATKSELLKDARSAARKDFGAGLYMAIGHAPSVGRGRTTLQYIGIGDPLVSRLGNNHHAMREISITQLWLGEVATAGIPGRRTKRAEPHLDIVEWAHAYFLRIPVNARKKINPPQSSCIVLNRWWQQDYETPTDRPAARWADVIEFDSIRSTVNLVWFGARGRIARRNV